VDTSSTWLLAAQHKWQFGSQVVSIIITKPPLKTHFSRGLFEIGAKIRRYDAGTPRHLEDLSLPVNALP
jgi:hypothetical protein